MSTFRKDRNNLYIALDGRSGEYRLDLSNGIFYGIKGSPIKTAPAGELYRLFVNTPQDNASSHLAYALASLFNNYGCGKTEYIGRYLSWLGGAEKLDSINQGRGRHYSSYEYEWVNEHMSDLAKWLKAHPNTALPRNLNEITAWLKWENDRKKLGAEYELITAEMYDTMTNYRWSQEEMSVAAYYLGRGKYWEYHNGNLSTLNNYFAYCKEIKKKPDKVNNFMREYAETKKEYEIRKTEIDMAKIAENYAKHTKAWEFEYGRYKIVVPTCPDDIIMEGRNMSHCVGGYVGNVLDNTTYIVFVRPIDNPEKCYITCQVHTSGRIGQYFLSHDRYISSDEDKEFYNAYAEHLKKVWNE